ncbi:MAG: hypothetical protein J1F02_10940 [Lachnospiraceae bacterium]|nr:hypothetical protein [Lachnospiraceae bacterium]
MMMTLLVLKSRIKNFYEKHYRIARSFLRMCLAFAAFLIVTGELNPDGYEGSYWLLVLGAVVCGVAPDIISALCVLLLACVEISQISLLAAVTVLLLVLVYFLLFGRLEKRQLFLMLSIPLLSAIHIGYAVPLVAALYVSPVMIPAVLMGILLQFAMRGILEYSAAVTAVSDTENILSPLQYLMDYLLRNQLMVVTMLAFCLTFVCVYVIRRGKYKYGPQIGILVGTLLLMTVELLSNIILELNMDLAVLTLQVVISMVITYVIQFFHITLDYHGTRKLQFEDDEYYYYVTAVPKFKVAVVDKTVTRIVPDEGDSFDLKEELEKALEEEEAEAESENEM